MNRKNPNQPAPVETEILSALWEIGPCPVKRIHERLNAGKESPRVITTTLKLLQVMMGKGFVERDESTWPHTYRAVIAKETLQRSYVVDSLQRVFDGSVQNFLSCALDADAVSQEEIEAIRALLKSYEEAKGND